MGRKRSSPDGRKGKGKRKEKRVDEDDYDSDIEIVGEVQAEAVLDDWCFVCKNGGKIRFCDHPNCEKCYHYGCVGQKKSFLTSSEDWECPQHSCVRCKGIPTVACYTCPNAVCDKCFDASEFVCIGDLKGFCEKCMKLVLYIEGKTKQNPSPVDYSAMFEHFVEYYNIIKEKYGINLEDLQNGKLRLRSREKRKSSSLDEIDLNERLGGIQKMKLDSSETSQNEKVIIDRIKVPALVPANVKLIYLTRSVVEKLLMQPESFENKVQKTFVGIELPQRVTSNKIARQLVQVTGITKTSCHDGRISVKLQAKNMPNDISIDMVSDLDFSEILCKDLRQQAEDGQIEMPAYEELERMARALSEVMVDDFISRETRRLQHRMDRANERGRRQEFFLLEYKKKVLQMPGERLQLIGSYPTVIIDADDVNTMPETINETQEIKGSSESIPNSVTLCENDMIDLGFMSKDMMDGKKEQEGCCKLISEKLELNRRKSKVTNHCKESLGISHPVKVKASKGQEIKGSSESIPNSVTLCENDMIDSVGSRLMSEDMMAGEIQKEGCCKLISEKLELNRQKSEAVTNHCKESLGISHPVKVKACEGQGMKVNIKTIKSPRMADDQELFNAAEDEVQEIDEELINVVDHSIVQSFAVESECNILQQFSQVSEEQNWYDVMHEEFGNYDGKFSEKIDGVKDKLNPPEVQLDDLLLKFKRLASEDLWLSATKLASMEEKIDRIEQQLQQIEKLKSTEAGCLSYKRSEKLEVVLLKLIEQVCSLACNRTMEEIKAIFLPNLDLNHLAAYDPNATKSVHSLLKETVQSFIDDGLALQDTIEEQPGQSPETEITCTQPLDK